LVVAVESFPEVAVLVSVAALASFLSSDFATAGVGLSASAKCLP